MLDIVARGLGASGLVSRVAQWLLGADRDVGRPSARFLGPVPLASAFVNNTPVVPTLAPAVVRWCERYGRSPQPLLIPLSYAAILGGTCTLVGTSTNLIVAGQARAAGRGPACPRS